MGAQGTAILNFGAFPGSSVTSVDVNTVGVVATSAVEAWIRPVVSADHSDIDHVAARIRVVGSFLSNDNIRIYGINENDVIPPFEGRKPTGQENTPASAVRPHTETSRQNSPMLVGQYNVWWVWN